MTSDEIRCTVEGVFTGRIERHWPDKAPSAIHKTAADGPQIIGPSGIETDAQADLTVHGGADKALHHYAADHYVTWREEGLLPGDATPAAFGENISTTGITETDLCIGDVFRLGTALVQISQGREPCWKLCEYTGQPTMAYRFRKTARTGWYYRVLEAGRLAPGDEMSLTDRPHPEWSLHEVSVALLSRRVPKQTAAQLVALPVLAEAWRKTFSQLAG
ncbi:MOSC domain-containing protein [uncultured Roseobacter sp.]|uniref:MOSC domain-containing protein n=1 Tax=uncultured Roseobacter sp. TaxID=114847 RepID=UPI00261EBCF3|nr:MOSC domain-containing protein [uncultured Roseobacter sp.]